MKVESCPGAAANFQFSTFNFQFNKFSIFNFQAIIQAFKQYLFVFDGQLEAYTVYVDDLHLWVDLEVFAQLGDIYVHAACRKIAVVFPNLLQGAGAVYQLVEVHGEHTQQFALFHGQSLHVVATGEGLMGIVE